MKNSLKLISVFASLIVAISAQAEVTIENAWVRATVPQQTATAAYFQIQSSTDARLVSVKTPAAGSAEIHEMKMQNKVMKMRAKRYLDLPAGKLVELAPGGLHVMLMDLKAQIAMGDAIPLVLVVEGKDKKRQTLEILLKTRPLDSATEGKM